MKKRLIFLKFVAINFSKKRDEKFQRHSSIFRKQTNNTFLKQLSYFRKTEQKEKIPENVNKNKGISTNIHKIGLKPH